MKDKHLKYWFCFVVAALMAVTLPMQAFATARFGTQCQKEFENGWLDTLSYAWDNCGWFNDELDDTDTKVFYYNLHNSKWAWEEGGDSGRLDNVNLFYAKTHGGGWSDRSVWAMWNNGVNADSLNMRLGDDSYGLSILATDACETLKFDDNKMWTRMGRIFKGGLRIAVGSHQDLFDGVTTNENGEAFADNLQKSHTIKWAWKDGVSDWYADQDAAVMATGATAADCGNRRDTMKWQNYTSYPRLKDGQIKYYCYWYWDDL